MCELLKHCIQFRLFPVLLSPHTVRISLLFDVSTDFVRITTRDISTMFTLCTHRQRLKGDTPAVQAILWTVFALRLSSQTARLSTMFTRCKRLQLLEPFERCIPSVVGTGDRRSPIWQDPTSHPKNLHELKANPNPCFLNLSHILHSVHFVDCLKCACAVDGSRCAHTVDSSHCLNRLRIRKCGLSNGFDGGDGEQGVQRHE